MRNPFSLYKKLTKQGLVWYALKRSTGIVAEGKRERRREAERKALEMLADFWKLGSPYARECALLKKKRPLSAYYVSDNAANVRCYIKIFPGGVGFV